MKKKDIIGLVFWLIVFGGFIAYFFLVVRKYYADGGSSINNWFLYYLFVVLTIIVVVILNSFLHELFHVIGAKIGKYKITFVSVMGLTIFYESKKTRIGFSKFNGLTGETKITPKEKNEKSANPVPFIYGFTFIVVLEIIAFFVSFILLKDSTNSVLKDFGYHALTALLTTAVLWIYDILPINMDNLTDGYRLLTYRKEGKEKFNRSLIEANGGNLNIEQEIAEEEKQEIIPTGNNETTLYYFLNKNDFVKAEEIVDAMLADENISKKIVIDIKCYKIFFRLLNLPLDEGKIYYDQNVSIENRREIGDVKSVSKSLAYILMSGLYDKSYSECLLAANKCKKLIAREHENRRAVDENLYFKAVELVKKEHPNWEI